jgi:hypothetical protein
VLILMFATCAHEAQTGEVVAVGQWTAGAAFVKFSGFVNKKITTPGVLAVGGILAVGYYAWKKNKQGAEVLSIAEEVPSTSVDRDSQVERNFNVQKIDALVQGKQSYGSYGAFWYNTCSCYAIFFADLLIKHFKGRKASHGVDDLNETVFQSNLAFAGTSDLVDYKGRKSIQPCFLTEFNLVEEFRAIDIAAKTALKDARVGEIAKKVNPKITVVLKPEAIAPRLKDSNGYQVLICKSENDHWTAFGIDYLEDKIYFVDSLGYLNYKNQKYSSDNIEIISQIRAGMSALKKKWWLQKIFR